MAPPLLTLRDVSLNIGNKPLFINLELHIGKGERICLVGRNGTGKSTLMKTIAGQVEPDSGEIFIHPGTHISYLPQDVDLQGFDTVADYIYADLGTDYHKADPMMMALGVDGSLSTANLSGGEARRAALIRYIVSEPDVLLLDEPTNHLDLPAIKWLEETLGRFRGGLVIVSHDRAFLNRLGRSTFWLDRGSVRRMDKNFAHFEEWAEEILTRETVERSKLDKKIAEETTWSRQGISARRTRNQGRLRNLYALREQRTNQISQVGKVSLESQSGGKSGKLVVEAENISKSFADTPIISDFSLRVLRGYRIGIIGPNGAGKTTLLKLLTGELKPDTGTIKLGTNLTPTYIDQKRQDLGPNLTVHDYLCDAGGDTIDVRGTPKHVAGYLNEFLFDPGVMRSAVSSLSGGEQNRLILAKTLAKPTNLLILDEPTNDLDIETLDLLQEALSDYDGTLLVVSHDRDFLDRVVTSTVVFDGLGNVEEYVGGYSDYIHQISRNKEVGSPSLDSKNNKKKKNKSSSTTIKSDKLRLSNIEQQLLKNLPLQIKILEAEILDLTDKVNEPGISVQEMTDIGVKLGETSINLVDIEDRWLEVEVKRQEIEGE